MTTMSLILFGMILLFILLIVRAYNRLVTLRQIQKNAFSQIDVQLTRRYDLIPNLVESARAFMAHEKETLEKVILARNQAFQAKKDIAQNSTDARAMDRLLTAEAGVRSALGSFLAVSESYPELRSNENMKALMEELSTTENKVAYSRQAYNDATMVYNTAREHFPINIIAALFNFSPAAMFEIEDQKVREAVKVKF